MTVRKEVFSQAGSHFFSFGHNLPISRISHDQELLEGGLVYLQTPAVLDRDGVL